MVRLHSAASKAPPAGAFAFRTQLAEAGGAQPDSLGPSHEISIPGHKDDFVVTEFGGSGEMNGVVAAQTKTFGVLTGARRKLLVDANRGQLRAKLVEGSDRLSVLILPEPT
jgi:hypothetical protein